MELAGAHFDVLVAEDYDHDFFFLRKAFEQNGIRNVELHHVKDGVELLEHLADSTKPRPSLIFLDLNMPRKDGREALREMKASETLKSIPVVAFTTSSNQGDVRLMYELGASAYIVKPTGLKELIELVKTLSLYWFRAVRLPDGRSAYSS